MPVEIKRLLFTFAHCAFAKRYAGAIRQMDERVMGNEFLLWCFRAKLELAVYEGRLFR